MSSEILDPTRVNRRPKALKAEKTVHRITFNPSSANPGESLYVTMPKLAEHMTFVPYSTFLRFDLEVAKGHANNTVVQNVGRNLVQQFKVILGGQTIQDTDRYDLFNGYHDMATVEEDMMAGIMEEDYRKLRTDAGDKPTTSDDAKNAVKIFHCTAYGTKFAIPLTHPILDEHGVFYQKGLMDDLQFEIKLAGADYVTITSDASKDYSYKLTNTQLEYTTILSDKLSGIALSVYQGGRTFLFEDVHLFKTIPDINLKTKKTLAIQINDSRRCLKGAFIIFTKNFTVGTRDTEEFVNPKIVKVSTTIDGVPHKVYSDGMTSTDLWPFFLGRLQPGDHFGEVDFHSDKFALWVDLRASPDNSLHGDGKVVRKTNDGIRLDIQWKGRGLGGSGTVVTCYVFLVSDAGAYVKDGRLNEFMLK